MRIFKKVVSLIPDSVVQTVVVLLLSQGVSGDINNMSLLPPDIDPSKCKSNCVRNQLTRRISSSLS